MATTFKTVSEESGWTDWSNLDRGRPAQVRRGPMLAKLAIGVALLLLIVYAWPANINW